MPHHIKYHKINSTIEKLVKYLLLENIKSILRDSTPNSYIFFKVNMSIFIPTITCVINNNSSIKASIRDIFKVRVQTTKNNERKVINKLICFIQLLLSLHVKLNILRVCSQLCNYPS